MCLKAKKGFKSIVEFHAVIFNRWGQKLFEWNNPNEAGTELLMESLLHKEFIL